MNIYKHRSILQKIILSIVFVTLFNFVSPTLIFVSRVEAAESTEEDDDIAGIGGMAEEGAGILFSPLFALVNFIVDTIASAMQSFMMHNAEAVMTPSIDHYAETDSTDADVVINKKYGLISVLYPNFTFSCEEIFANKVPMLDVNFLNPSVTDLGDTTVNEKHNVAAQLQKIIKAWYRVLRMIAIVGLLSVLIYIGIRIMIDSNTANKAKYKEKLLDWVVALVIIFTMHYIMSFTLTMSEELTKLFSGSDADTRNIIVQYNGNGSHTFKTNLIGLARFKVQNDNIISKLSYEIIYIALLVYTIKFTIVYLKRVMNMAFLTIISPLVALMYPVQDGKSQAFGMWLREYIFNALLQPMHYLLYTVLISSSISLAANNPLYAIVALAFMTQAEKFLKSIFGFDKAKGGMMGGMSAFASGALASNLISGMKKGGNSNGGKANAMASALAGSRAPKLVKDADVGGLPAGPQGGGPRRGPDDLPGGGPQNGPDDLPGGGPRRGSDDLPGGGPQNGPDDLPGGGPQNGPDDLPGGGPQNGPDNLPDGSPQSIDLADSMSSISYLNQTSSEQRRSGRNQVLKNSVGKLGKKLFWDKDKSTKENILRHARRYAKVGMGALTAAATIGASITDGKLSVAEPIIAAGVGAKAASRTVDKGVHAAENLHDMYRTGAQGEEAANLLRFNQKWHDDDQVNENYNNEYGKKAAEKKRIAEQEFNSRGITNFDEQKQLFKYMDAMKEEQYKYDYSNWEEQQKEQIRRENASFSERQVQAEFENRKAEQIADARTELGSTGSTLNDDEVLKQKFERDRQEAEFTEWTENEKQVIRNENANLSEEEVQATFDMRKEEQATQIRNNLGKEGRALDDDQAIRRALNNRQESQYARRAATTLKFRQNAEKSNAIANPKNQAAYIERRARAINRKNPNISLGEAKRRVANSFNEVEKFDAANNL